MDSTSLAYQQTKAAVLVIVMWFIILLSSAMLAGVYIAYNDLRIVNREGGTVFFLGAFVFAAGAALAMTTAQENHKRVKALGDEPPPDRPTGRPQRDPTWNQPAPPRTPFIVPDEDNPKHLKSCRYPFGVMEWRRLVVEMQKYAAATGSRYWVFSRDETVRPARIFTNEITPGVNVGREWKQILNEFERLDIIRKRGGSWHVTEPAMYRLSVAAGLPVVSLWGDE